jgi:hypothetical protein
VHSSLRQKSGKDFGCLDESFAALSAAGRADSLDSHAIKSETQPSACYSLPTASVPSRGCGPQLLCQGQTVDTANYSAPVLHAHIILLGFHGKDLGVKDA